MENYANISSIESIILPEGPHVTDFDSAQRARKKQLTMATSGQIGAKSPAEMNFGELNSAIDAELISCKERLIPYLVEMRKLLNVQGQRNDLRGVPSGWQKWVESKKTSSVL